MTVAVAFLRAINLGPTRKFPAAAVKAATEAVGATDVATWLNTGNVRFTTSLRSRERIEAALEAAYAEAAGFEVPTVVLSPAEVVATAADAVRLGREYPGVGMQYVSILKNEPDPVAAAAFGERWRGPDHAVVLGRTVHLLLAARDNYHGSSLANDTVERAFGVATNRNARVIATLAERWG